MNKIQIRYNTHATEENDLRWRIIINGEDFLADSIEIRCPCRTTQDWIEGIGMKWHITCENAQFQWKGQSCIVF